MVAAAILYFVLLVLSDLSEVAAAAVRFKWLYLIPALALAAGNYLVRSERWHAYLKEVGLGLPRRKSYWLFLSGLSMSITPVKAGEALKALLLRLENGAQVERGVAVVFAERMSDMTGMVLLIGIGSFALSYSLVPLSLVVVVMGAILLVLSSERASGRVVRTLKSRKRLSGIGAMIEGALRDARQLLTGWNLVKGTLFGAAAWALECVAFFLIAVGCRIEVGLLECIFIYAFSSVVGAISMLPGGMGTTEATMVGLLIALSVIAPVASFAVIVTRMCTLWFAVVVGTPFVLTYMSRSREAKAAWFDDQLVS